MGKNQRKIPETPDLKIKINKYAYIILYNLFIDSIDK